MSQGGFDKLLLKANAAATLIQSLARGHAARRKTSALRKTSDARRLMMLMMPSAVSSGESSPISPSRMTPQPSQAAVAAVSSGLAQPFIPANLTAAACALSASPATVATESFRTSSSSGSAAAPPTSASTPSSFVMPPLPPGPPPCGGSVPAQPQSQPSLLQPQLPLGTQQFSSSPALSGTVMQPAAQASLLSGMMPPASTTMGTPAKLDYPFVPALDGNAQQQVDDLDFRRQQLQLQQQQQQQQMGQYESPQTPWTSRVHSRVQAHADGMNQMSPVHRMSMANMMAMAERHQQLSPQERLLTAVVMQRFCRWGEHRTVADWPAELIAYGPLPAVHDALKGSRTRSLTLPQLVTAIKERTGGCAGGKALDMLNLKAYVRCFPDKFHLRSGRTAQGRPLDLVEMRVDGAPATAGVAQPPPQQQLQQQYQSLQMHQQQMLPAADEMESLGALAASAGLRLSDMGHNHLGGQGASSPLTPPPQHGHTSPHMASAPSAAVPPPLNLQPKELFSGGGGALGGAPAAAAAAAQPLWGNALGGFSLFGVEGCSTPTTPNENKENPAADAQRGPSEPLSPALGAERPACAPLPLTANQAPAPGVGGGAADPKDPMKDPIKDPMLSQIQGLFVDDGPDDAGELGNAAQRRYIQAHDLHSLFLQAVERAMEQDARNPADFIGRELMRFASFQDAVPDAAASRPLEQHGLIAARTPAHSY